MPSYRRRGNKNTFLLTVEAGFNERGKRTRRTKTIKVDPSLLKTKRKLENYLNQELVKFEMEVQAGEYIAPEKRQLNEFIEDWREKHAKKNYAYRTLQGYDEKLNNYILPRFGHQKIEQIKPMQIVNFLDDISKPGAGRNKQGKPLSQATLYEIDKTLRVVFNKAVEWQVLKQSPLKGLKRPKIKKKKMQYFDEDDVIEFIKALYKEPINWRIYFLTAAVAGMRRGETLALEWSDFDFENQDILLTKSIPDFDNGRPIIKSTKTDEDIRKISMPKWYMEEAKVFYRHWLKEKMMVGEKWRGGDNTFLFHGGEGIPYTPNSVNKTWRNIKHRHYLKDIRVHDLRHTMITYLLQEGESLKNVQERAGHSSSRITTDIYGHVTKKGHRSTADRFEKFNPKHFGNNSATSGST
ncbi:tyrosine-type recombinase/integrase [Halobacillus sp. MO56]